VSDETPHQEDDFDDVLGDEDDFPVDDYRLSTRPGVVSGEQ
jgi:hypothetical protein